MLPASAADPVVGLSASGVSCESLKGLDLPGVTITIAESVVKKPIQEKPGIVVYGPDWKSPKSAFGEASVPVNFCRVGGLVQPTINFEVWLPLAEKWNGKFNGVGNGALAGGINYPAMAVPVSKGYAVASTDGGHQSPAPVVGDWILGHPELWDDFGYRAVHEMTRASKAIVAAFYAQAPKYAYFTGCSGGGQQGLAEAQRYPADYNGVVSGTPANLPDPHVAGRNLSFLCDAKEQSHDHPGRKAATDQQSRAGCLRRQRCCEGWGHRKSTPVQV